MGALILDAASGSDQTQRLRWCVPGDLEFVLRVRWRDDRVTGRGMELLVADFLLHFLGPHEDDMRFVVRMEFTGLVRLVSPGVDLTLFEDDVLVYTQVSETIERGTPSDEKATVSGSN